jgi:hypothetical protein
LNLEKAQHMARGTKRPHSSPKHCPPDEFLFKNECLPEGKDCHFGKLLPAKPDLSESTGARLFFGPGIWQKSYLDYISNSYII